MSGEKPQVNIPKFIRSTPWYHRNETEPSDNDLSHHQVNPKGDAIDYSTPEVGVGVKDSFEIQNGIQIRKNDDWDAKRDRWHGFDAEEWDRIEQNWDRIKKKTKNFHSKDNDDSDSDTDYELELMELGLSKKDISCKLKEDPMEKVLRDRQDVPEYIKRITTSASGKIRATNLSEETDFISQNEINEKRSASNSIRQLEKFAWEINKNDEIEREKRSMQKRLQGELDQNQGQIDLSLNLQANPTLMYLKNKENQQKLQDAKNEKRRKLQERYG